MRRIGLITLVILLAAGFYWWRRGSDGGEAVPAAEVPAPPSATSAPQPIAAEPSDSDPRELRIARSGRITIDLASRPAGEPLEIELELADDARGSEPLPVKVVSMDGRLVETTAAPAAGSGLRLELEPGWLRPGRYMIQVTTAEKTPLHLSRYVIEVVDSRLADPKAAPTEEQPTGQQEPE